MDRKNPKVAMLAVVASASLAGCSASKDHSPAAAGDQRLGGIQAVFRNTVSEADFAQKAADGRKIFDGIATATAHQPASDGAGSFLTDRAQSELGKFLPNLDQVDDCDQAFKTFDSLYDGARASYDQLVTVLEHPEAQAGGGLSLTRVTDDTAAMAFDVKPTQTARGVEASGKIGGGANESVVRLTSSMNMKMDYDSFSLARARTAFAASTMPIGAEGAQQGTTEQGGALQGSTEQGGAQLGSGSGEQLGSGSGAQLGSGSAEQGGAQQGTIEQGGAFQGGAQQGTIEQGGAYQGGAQQSTVAQGADQGGAQQGSAEQGGVHQGTVAQGGAFQGGAEQGTVAQGGAFQGGAEQGTVAQGGAYQGGAQQGTVAQGGAFQGGAQQGTADQGGAQQGTSEQGGAQPGPAAQGAQQGTTEQGGALQGGAQQGTVEQGGAYQGGVQHGTTEQGGAHQGSVEQGGTAEQGHQGQPGAQQGSQGPTIGQGENLPAGQTQGHGQIESLNKVELVKSTEIVADLAARTIDFSIDAAMTGYMGAETADVARLKGSITVSDGANKFVAQKLSFEETGAAPRTVTTDITARLIAARTIEVKGKVEGAATKPMTWFYQIVRAADGTCAVHK